MMNLCLVQILTGLLLLLVHSLVLLAAGFGLAHLYFATSMDHGRLTLNQALHVHQHNYSGSLWFLHRSVMMSSFASVLHTHASTISVRFTLTQMATGSNMKN